MSERRVLPASEPITSTKAKLLFNAPIRGDNREQQQFVPKCSVLSSRIGRDRVTPLLIVLGPRAADIATQLPVGIERMFVVDGRTKHLVMDMLENQYLLVQDFNDPEMLIALSERLGQRPQRFYTNNERGVMAAALANDHVKLRVTEGQVMPWPFPEATPMSAQKTIYFRDKERQKAKLVAVGVQTAKTWLIQNFLMPVDLTFPCVLKPVAGAAAADTHIVSSAEDLQQILSDWKDRQGKTPRVLLIEDFIAGVEFHLDGWVEAGVPRWIGCARYLQPCLEIRNGTLVSGVTLDPEREPSLYSRLVELARQALQALELRSGVFHIEVFRTRDDRLIFSEAAMRVAGDPIPGLLRASAGINLHQVALDLHCGLSPSPPGTERLRVAAHTDLPAPTAGTSAVPSVLELRSRPGVVEASYHLKPGADVPDYRVKTNVSAGNAVVCGSNEAEAIAKIHGLIRFVEKFPASLKEFGDGSASSVPQFDSGDADFSGCAEDGLRP
jgi:hypothetical protein